MSSCPAGPDTPRPPPPPIRVGPASPTPRARVVRTGVFLSLSLLPACGETEAPEAGAPRPSPAARVAAPPVVERTFERELVFVSRDDEGVPAIPVRFRTELREGLDTRSREVWFAGEEGWDVLISESDTTTERLAPWRIVPGPGVRLVVGPDEALETLFLRDPARPLEVRLGIPLAQWPGVGAGDETLRFHRAVAELPAGEVDGYLLDLSVVHDGRAPARDWIFLHGGEALQAAFVERPDEPDPRTRRLHRGWTRWAVRENNWPEVVVEWAEVTPFERARRDVPVRWRIESTEGRVAGELEAVSRHLVVEEGEGPLLPVRGFFRVRGELRVGGEAFEVVGVVAHTQR